MFKPGDKVRVLVNEPMCIKLAKGEIVTIEDGPYDCPDKTWYSVRSELTGVWAVYEKDLEAVQDVPQPKFKPGDKARLSRCVGTWLAGTEVTVKRVDEHRVVCYSESIDFVVFYSDELEAVPDPRLDHNAPLAEYTAVREISPGQFVTTADVKAKDPNPKDLAAVSRAPLALVPPILTAEASLAFLEGALKYGPYNWRSAPVKSTVYLGAMLRHIARILDGEDTDPKTTVSHLGAIAASCGILLDAARCGTLVDDRPPPGKAGEALDEIPVRVKQLREALGK